MNNVVKQVSNSVYHRQTESPGSLSSASHCPRCVAGLSFTRPLSPLLNLPLKLAFIDCYKYVRVPSKLFYITISSESGAKGSPTCNFSLTTRNFETGYVETAFLTGELKRIALRARARARERERERERERDKQDDNRVKQFRQKTFEMFIARGTMQEPSLPVSLICYFTTDLPSTGGGTVKSPRYLNFPVIWPASSI